MLIEVNNYAHTTSSSTALTLSFTVNSGEERALYVCVYNNAANITSITFGGQSLTQLGGTNSNVYENVQWWGLFQPTVGTDTITINASGATTGATAICLNNVDQTSLNLNPPGVTVVSSANNANVQAWCGDMPDRAMYCITSCYGNTGISFTYDTAFNTGLDFPPRTARNPAFTDIFSASGGEKGIAGLGRIPASETWKFSITHLWGGVPPTNSLDYLFINETTTPAFIGGQMMII